MDFGDAKEVSVLNAGSDDEMRIYEHSNFRFSTINKVCKAEGLTHEEAYAKYYDRVFTVTNAQTSLLTKVNDLFPEKGKLLSYKYVPKTGRNKGKEDTKYVWDKTLVVWLKDSAYVENNRVIKTEKIGTLWDNISWGRLDIEGDITYKNGKKPTALIRQLMNMVTVDGDYVLDFFSGSASTAHACMLESAEGKKIHSISIQLPEDLDEELSHDSSEKKKELKKLTETLDESGRRHFLDEIGQERLVRSAKQIREKQPDTEADLGFLHYTLAEPSSVTLQKLEQFSPEDNGLFSDNTILDEFGIGTVLSTWLVRDGYGFTARAEEIDFSGYTGYYMDKHLYLISHNLSNDAIGAITEKYATEGSFNPENVVLFGYSFTWTQIEALKLNLARLKSTEKNSHINFDIRY